MVAEVLTGAKAGGASSTAEVVAVSRAGSPARTMAGNSSMRGDGCAQHPHVQFADRQA